METQSEEKRIETRKDKEGGGQHKVLRTGMVKAQQGRKGEGSEHLRSTA